MIEDAGEKLRLAEGLLRTRQTLSVLPPERRSVLVLEDNVELLASLSRSLMAAGYVVTASQNAEHAMSLIRYSGCQIDVALIDVVLPGIDGIRFIEEAREAYPDLPVVIMTGDVSRLNDLSAKIPVLLKPFRTQQMLDLVRKSIQAP